MESDSIKEKTDPNISATLVHHSGGPIRVPQAMGKPIGDKLQGKPLENLAELAGRVCYDSLSNPNGRDSKSYHEHIQEVGHNSVLEHSHVFLEVDLDLMRSEFINFVLPTTVTKRRPKTKKLGKLYDKYIVASLNEIFGCIPGAYPPEFPETGRRSNKIVFDINLRHIVEWDQFKPAKDTSEKDAVIDTNFKWKGYRPPRGFNAYVHEFIGEAFKQTAPWCPLVIKGRDQTLPGPPVIIRSVDLMAYPLNPNNKWVTMYLSMSRSCSHELVRHGDKTAISQRSTRYVDESHSDHVKPPIVSRMLEYSLDFRSNYIENMSAVEDETLDIYDYVKNALQGRRLRSDAGDIGKKQARGAARYNLPIGTRTEMLFSASVPQWRHILDLRGGPAADPEISTLSAKILRELENNHITGFEDYRVVRGHFGAGLNVEKC